MEIGYFQPGVNTNLIFAFLTIGHGSGAISTGMGIEIICALVASYFYFRVKNLSVYYSLLYAFIVYSIIFLLGALPYFLKWGFNSLGFEYHYSDWLMIYTFLLLGAILLTVLFYLADKDFFIWFIKKIYSRQMIYHELMLLFGVTIAFHETSFSIIDYFHFFQERLISLILLMISLFFFSATLTAFTNSKELEKTYEKNFKIMRNIFLFLAIFYALFAGIKVAYILITVMMLFYIYYVPPFNLSRLPILPPVFFLCQYILFLLAGYLVILDNIYQFPAIVIYALVIAYALCMLAKRFFNRSNYSR
ncbi:MAG: hypothetical protein JO149_05145 [Gammaproteobacteria bacterium]|nr:hypothetical protein [Gammaproteobacteria bacterium]